MLMHAQTCCAPGRSAWPSASSPPQAPRQRGPAPCQATGQVIREVLRRQDRCAILQLTEGPALFVPWGALFGWGCT